MEFNKTDFHGCFVAYVVYHCESRLSGMPLTIHILHCIMKRRWSLLGSTMDGDDLINESDLIASKSKKGWEEIDYNHDGKIEAKDLLAIYDENGDGECKRYIVLHHLLVEHRNLTAFNFSLCIFLGTLSMEVKFWTMEINKSQINTLTFTFSLSIIGTG